jgi:Sulfotransferase family
MTVAQNSPAGGTSWATDAGRPVIVLTYRYTAASGLQSLLASDPQLACTAGSGIIPLCHQAAAAWRRLEPGQSGISALARSSIRSLAGTMMAAVLLSAGKPRWCETATLSAHAAGTFAELYPDSRFLCLHRGCEDVIRTAIRATPWGLAGQGLGTFAAAYPGSGVAALAAYWAEYAAPLVEFEDLRPDQCLRILSEDLAARPDAIAASVSGFLGINGYRKPLRGGIDPAEVAADPELAELSASAPIPLNQIPEPLLDVINNLQAQLGYPQMGRSAVQSDLTWRRQKMPRPLQR